MLKIDRAIRDAIIAHARREHPVEACGLVAGPDGSDRPQRLIPMRNAENSTTIYRYDSMEQLRVWREMEERDEMPVVIYHSHAFTPAYPSGTDVAYAFEPSAHYVIVSTRDERTAEFRSFRIIDEVITEEPVEVVESFRFGHSPTEIVYDCPSA